MAVRARETVLAGYTWSACAARTTGIYDSVIADDSAVRAPDYIPASFATVR
jgi:hypothetical protein